MPTVLREKGYRFFFFSNESQEPPHVHIQAERYARFWLRPIRLAKNVGFRRNEITQLGKIVGEKKGFLLKAWYGHLGK